MTCTAWMLFGLIACTRFEVVCFWVEVPVGQVRVEFQVGEGVAAYQAALGVVACYLHGQNILQVQANDQACGGIFLFFGENAFEYEIFPAVDCFGSRGFDGEFCVLLCESIDLQGLQDVSPKAELFTWAKRGFFGLLTVGAQLEAFEPFQQACGMDEHFVVVLPFDVEQSVGA